jgi:aminopeptidase N
MSASIATAPASPALLVGSQSRLAIGCEPRARTVVVRGVLPIACWVACGGKGMHGSDAPGPLPPTANADREVVDTKLQVDVTALSATATITLGPSTSPGATLEVGDLTIASVQSAGVDVPFAIASSKMDLGLPASDQPIAIDIAYHFMHHEGFTGASATGYTMIWPYYCGNLFPCHSEPADGTTFTLDVQGVPPGMTAVFPPAIPASAPSYQIAWSIDAYTELPLGTTTAGTQLSVWYGAGGLGNAQIGTAHLVAAFDWLEKTYGPYQFGSRYGSVGVAWPRGAYGGMEHHPRSHIADAAMASEETHVHEAAHGWFGDGIRIACWEDFVLSEGTVSYLAAHVLDVLAPTVGANVWQGYANELANITGSDPVWPQSCGQVDILKGNLFTNAPYMRGAFFYKGIADKIGADALDRALAMFYQQHAGGTAHMSDMLATIHSVTGYDPSACAQTWLLGTTTPTPAPCP